MAIESEVKIKAKDKGYKLQPSAAYGRLHCLLTENGKIVKLTRLDIIDRWLDRQPGAPVVVNNGKNRRSGQWAR